MHTTPFRTLALSALLLALLSGCSWMPSWATPSRSDFIPAVPPEGKALVYFYRLAGPADPDTFPALMMDAEEVLWGLPPNNYWPHAVDPGTHVFATRTPPGTLSPTLTLEAVEEGMVYYLRLDPEGDPATSYTLSESPDEKAAKELFPLARLLGFGS